MFRRLHARVPALLALALGISSFVHAPSAWSEPAPIEHYLKRSMFNEMQISPDGRHLAATVPRDDDSTLLLVVDIETMKPTATLGMRGKEHVDSFHWVSDSRLLVSATKKEGTLDRPVPTGELFGVNADGSGAGILFGYRAGGGGGIRTARTPEQASAFPLDVVPDRDRQVLVVVEAWGNVEGNLREVRRMDVDSGRTIRVVRSVLPRSWFLVDREGNVRITWGYTTQGKLQVHQRPAEGGDWQLLHDEGEAGYAVRPLTFDADGSSILLRREHTQGSDGIYRMRLSDGSMEEVLRHPHLDPGSLLRGLQHGHVYAVHLNEVPTNLGFLDSDDVREVRLAKAIRAAFPGQHAYITSFTRDGKRALVRTYGDRNPGEFFLFDLEQMRATYIASVREWLTPDQLGQMRAIELSARDGARLHGFLQLPPGAELNKLPLVINPHGGPHGIYDEWGYDEEAQLLASRGYAVLKLNFRGSGGYGRAFEQSGYREWGGTMQDDMADAVRWAVEQGWVDPERVCIYGGSYGGYSALMNAARYPELYRCTIGYVGVYDLGLMFNDGDIRQSLFGRSYLNTVLGAGEILGQFSPVNHAERITMPVLLIHGGEDQRVPISHANRMRAALRKAGNEPEWLVERREGHGFYNMDNRVKLYTQLLAFLDRHIGSEWTPRAQGEGATASAASGAEVE